MNQNPKIQARLKMKNKKINNGVLVLIIIAAVAVLLAIAQIIASFAGTPSHNNNKNKKNAVPRGTGKYVAELYIDGVIQEETETYNQKWLLETIEFLKNDSRNEGILLYIDSPGGAVYQADELYLALMDYRDKKPVWAYFGPLVASGGYYIGCSAEKIAANRNTLTGSIGVIAGKSVDLTEFMQKHGVKMTTITSGKNKNMFSIDSPVTPEQKEIMQAISDECYEQFVGIVADSRHKSKDEVKVLADGRVYTANQALSNGLIDKVCSLDEFKEDYKLFLRNDKIDFRQVKYEREKKFYEDFFDLSTKLKSPDAELEFIKDITSQNMQYPAFIYEGR